MREESTKTIAKKLIFPLAIIFKSGIIKTEKLLWYTNPHISVDRLIFVLSGDRGLLTVCRLAHPEATEVSSESPTCFFTSRVQYKPWIIGTNTASSLLSSVGRAVDS